MLISILTLNRMLVRFLPSSAAASIYLFKPPYAASGQSRVYRVTQLRTDGVHCRESAGTGSVNLKVAPHGCCLGRSSWTNHYWYEVGMLKVPVCMLIIMYEK